MSKTVPFQTIQFSTSTQFSSIQPIDQVLPLWARVDLGVMAMKGYSAFPKTLALLEPHHQIISYYIQDTRWRGGGLTPSAEKQLVYSTAPADWVTHTIVL